MQSLTIDVSEGLYEEGLYEEGLYDIVSEELTKMLSRSLKSAPASDEIHFYVEVMAQDLYDSGYEASDKIRLCDAFNYYGRNHDRWPSSLAIKQTIIERGKMRTMERQLNQKRLPEPQEVRRRRKEKGKIAIKTMRQILGDIEIVKKSEKKVGTITEEDHKRLMKEDSIEGILYREMMGAEGVVVNTQTNESYQSY